MVIVVVVGYGLDGGFVVLFVVFGVVVDWVCIW